jgi:hypothetical protein
LLTKNTKKNQKKKPANNPKTPKIHKKPVKNSQKALVKNYCCFTLIVDKSTKRDKKNIAYFNP